MTNALPKMILLAIYGFLFISYVQYCQFVSSVNDYNNYQQQQYQGMQQQYEGVQQQNQQQLQQMINEMNGYRTQPEAMPQGYGPQIDPYTGYPVQQ